MTFARAALLMAGLYLRTVARRRSLWLMGLLSLGVVAVFGWAALRADGAPARMEVWRVFLVLGPLGFLVQFAGLLYGLGAVSEDGESGTAAYVFSRPLPRGAIFLGRLAAAGGVTALLASGVNLAVWILAGLPGGPGAFLAAELPILAGALAYPACFMMLATLVRNPVVLGMLWLVLWELVAAQVPLRIKVLTLKYHLLCLAHDLVPGGAAMAAGGGAELFRIFGETAGEAAAVVLALSSGAVLLAWIRFRRMEP